MMNGTGSHYSSGLSDKLFVLYKIVNSECDNNDSMFNAFTMTRDSRGPTLATVKQHCVALHGLNPLGPEGYHWRVCVEDKAPSDSNSDGRGGRSLSWWDIQDENANLPIKEATQSEFAKFFAPSGRNSTPKDSVAASADSAAKALKSFGKAVTSVTNAVAGTEERDSGPPVAVLAFKLLDLVHMHDSFAAKHAGKTSTSSASASHQQQHHHHQPPRAAPVRQSAPANMHHHHSGAAGSRAAPSAQVHQHQQQRPSSRSATPTPGAPHAAQQQQQQQQQQQARPQQARPAPAQEASLMDFGDHPKSLNHGNSAALFGAAAAAPAPPANETRAQRTKREYAEKLQKSTRVWDDVDQRWVEVDPKAAGKNARSTSSAPPGQASANQLHEQANKKKEVGVSLDASMARAAGKSLEVQNAVRGRVDEMRKSQAAALQEVREREEKKKQSDAEEDAVRRQLEPKIKAWSEEHGKKKQLRALLGTLHTILWPEANWKPVSLGDILDDSKCKRCFHKASRVVHPDKTHHLDAQKRFLAKRIFDALSQAKTAFDDGAR